MTTIEFYGRLSDLMSSATPPSSMSGIGESVAALLDRIQYRDLIVEVAAGGDRGYYGLTLVTKELSVDLLGSGLALIFFPAEDDTAAASNIDLGFEYRWPILKYAPEFETLSFAHSARAFFEIFLELVDISDEEFLSGIVDALIDDPAPYDALVNKLKTWQDGSATPLAGLTLLNQPVGSSEIEYIVQQIPTNVDIFTAAFEAAVQDLSDVEKSIDNVVALFQTWLGGISRDDIEKLLLPQFAIELKQVSMAIEAPRSVLIPLDEHHQPIKNDPTKHSRLTFTAGGVRYDSSTGFEIDIDQNVTAAFTPSMIPGFGMTLEFDDIKIDLSRTTNIAEADADGRPADFMGVYIGNAVIGLPEKWFSTPTGGPPATLAIVGRRLLVGTGGLSGTAGLEALSLDPAHLGKPDPKGPLPPAQGAELEFILGTQPAPSSGDTRKGFKLGFSFFDLTFRQNVLLDCKIKGSMTIPKFKASPPDPNNPNKPLKLDIELHIAQDGDFDVTATVPGVGYPVEVPGVFIFTVKMLRVGKDDKRVFIRTSGDLSFDNNSFLKTYIKEPIHIEKLCIYSDGSFEIEGGSIPLPESAKIKFGPATIAITAVHCGAHEQDYGGKTRKYRFWGFDGGISVNPGGVDARGDGIKYYYTVDDDVPAGLLHHYFLRIEGLGIDLVIPGDMPKDKAALLLQGYLALKDPEYEGSLAFQLPKLKIAGGASMKYNTAVPAWIVDAHLELPKPIPVAQTGLGIYGFRGLFGLRYVAAKEAVKTPPLAPEASWGDYYRAPQKGIGPDKFLQPQDTAGASNPFSIGAGVSLATAADDGKAFSSQLFLLVSIPNLILLEGRGDVLAEHRVGLTDDDPPYYAYLALSPDSIEIGAGAHYMVPKATGEALDLHATLEAAFFFRNPSAWYVHFGTKQKPMTARVLSMFDAYAYLMLSASGIEAGTGVSYDFNKHYGPISVSAHAYLDLWVYLSFERPQVGGGIALGGYVDIRFIGIGFHIEIATGLTVEAPKPFRVAGYVHVCVSINLRIKKIEKCVDVEFVWDRNKSVDLSAVAILRPPAITPPLPSFAAGVHMGSGRSYGVQIAEDAPLAVNDIVNVVPLDTYIDVKFAKSLDPSSVALVAGYANPPSGNVEFIPPKYGSRTVRHSYKLDAVDLKVWCALSGTWIAYHPFAALAPEALLNAPAGPNLNAFPIGTWQQQDGGYSQIRFLALDPFNYMEPVGGYRPEDMGFDAATIFCAGKQRTETCVTWRARGLTDRPDTIFAADLDHYLGGLLFRIEGEDAAEIMVAVNPTRSMLAIKPGSRAILQFPGPVVRCRIALLSAAPSVTLRFQRRKPLLRQPHPLPSGDPMDPSTTQIAYAPLEFTDVTTLVVASNTLVSPFVYDDPDAPVDRVIIEPPAPDNRAIAALQDKIELRQEDWQRAKPEARPAIQSDILALQRQLRDEQFKTCHGLGFGRLIVRNEWFCATLIDEVCWLGEEDWLFNQTVPGAAAVEANFQNMRQAIESTIAPIWHPDEAYAIALTVSDTVTGPDNVAVPHGKTFYVHFKTGPALGHFVPDATIQPSKGDDDRQDIPERLLKFYIDMERTYPDPSGNLLYAKPLYYGAPVLRLFLAKPYAYHFFADWPAYPSSTAAARLDADHYKIEIRVKDPAESLPAANPADHETPLVTVATTGQQTWLADPAPRRTENLQVLSNMRDPPPGIVAPGTTCWQVGGGPITPAAKGLQVELHDLEPDKLYTAVVINRHTVGTATIDAEVHRYPFMTSRYRDFQSHIGSYRLTDEASNQRPAVFLVSHDLADATTAPTVYAAARDILQRIGATDSAAYPDFFDRLIHACLKPEPLPPALSLEFNFMRNALTQELYGIWIRSPEPLNDPRIPQDLLRSAIRMYVGGTEQPSALVLFSKDCCQAFVMTDAGAFPSPNVAFAFDHLVWDGKVFTAASVVQTDPFSAP